MKSGFVSFIGRPNAGKSTLLNRIIGDEARHRLRQAADDAEPDPRREELSTDGAGGVRRHAGHPPAAAPHERADGGRGGRHDARGRRASCSSSTPSTRPGHGDEFVFEPAEGRRRCRSLLVLNKIDLVAKTRLLPLIEQVQQVARLRRRSCRCRPRPATASSALERVILEQLPEGEPLYPGRLPDRPAGARARRRDRAREGAAAHARRAAVLDRGGRRPVRGAASATAACCRLYCTIFVERESQKPIVIGRGGEMIKRIGTEARHGPREVLRHEGVPRPARQGERRVARRRSRRSTTSACRRRRGRRELAASRRARRRGRVRSGRSRS